MKPTCDICTQAWPDPKYWIADFPTSALYLFEDQFFPGYCVLILKNHVTEIFELPAAERNALMEELSASAKVLATAFQAKKINYALLGNQTPHIHWHIIPRLTDDPIPKDPTFNYPHEKKLLLDSEVAQSIKLIREGMKVYGIA